jgi:hypothetical protein
LLTGRKRPAYTRLRRGKPRQRGFGKSYLPISRIWKLARAAANKGRVLMRAEARYRRETDAGADVPCELLNVTETD